MKQKDLERAAARRRAEVLMKRGEARQEELARPWWARLWTRGARRKE